MNSSARLYFALLTSASLLLAGGSLLANDASANPNQRGAFRGADDNRFTIMVGETPVTCARRNPRRPYLPVRTMRRQRVQPLRQFIRVLRERLQTQNLRPRRVRNLRARIREQRALLVASRGVCALGPGMPQAVNGSVSGKGVQALAATLPVQAPQGQIPFRCEVLGVSGDISVGNLQGCHTLIQPKSHRVGTAQVTFRAVRESDGAASQPAVLSVTFDQSGNFIGDHTSMAPYRDSLSRSEAFHLVRTAGMGAHADELIALAQQPGGLDAVVQRLTSPDNRAHCKAVEQQALAASYPYRQARLFRTGGTAFSATSPANRLDHIGTPQERLWTRNAAIHYWLYHMVHSCEPLRERVAMMWHNHFAVNFGVAEGNANNRSHWIKSHMDILRGKIPQAEGSLFTSIEHLVAYMHGADGIMLRWLTNNQNNFSSAGGNENYARELLELFTTGVDDIVQGSANYTEPHIYNLRFALMGYTDNHHASNHPTQETLGEFTGCCNASCTNSSCLACAALPPAQQCRSDLPLNFVYPRFFHNRWNATNQPISTYQFQGMPHEQFGLFKANVLGPDGRSHTPIFGDPSQDNLTPYLMYEHPGVRRFLAARLIATFASLELTDSLIEPVAKALVDNKYDPTEALRMILRSSAFYAQENTADSIANPAERIVTLIRLLDLPFDRLSDNNATNDLIAEIREVIWRSGYEMTRMPTVFGIQEAGKIVANEVSRGDAMLSAQAQVEALDYFTRYINALHAASNAGRTSFSWEDLLPAAMAMPHEILEHFELKLGVELSDAQRDIMYEYLTQVVRNTLTVDGLEIPHPESITDVDWSELSQAQHQSLWRMKAPGLIVMFWGLPQLALR